MSRTILLADDSVTIQKVIELTFMDQDFEVVAVSNGDEAIERLGELTPDFVIADVHMPGASGYEVCRRAKALHPGVPVLLLVGTFEPFKQDEAKAAGADGSLKKPFDSQELMRLVESLLPADGAAAAPTAAPAAAVSAEPAWPRPVPAPPAEPPRPAPQEPPEPAEITSSFRLGDLEEGEAAVAEPEELSLEEEDLSLVHPADDAGEATMAEPGGPAAWEPAAERPAASGAASPPAAASAEAEPSAPAGELSDSDVDRIARRLAELVGERVVREVAWEVVPDLAEVVIRDRLRELESQAE